MMDFMKKIARKLILFSVVLLALNFLLLILKSTVVTPRAFEFCKVYRTMREKRGY